MGRRIFVTGPEPETVDYAHRTTAEFLGASFLASQIRAGLPLGRVLALIGVDGHPAPELRGLHAWLAVHLPEHADQLVEADPYGVLTYGDAASLQPSACARLVQSLDRLSKQNPWFRSGNWQASPIGALARRDLVTEFRKVLNDPDAGFGVRSVIVDALSLGTPIPEMVSDLETIVARGASPFAERAHAVDALIRSGDTGKAAILNSYPKLGKSINELRLRAQIIEAYYGNPLGPDDVVSLVIDTSNLGEAPLSGMLFTLADRIPEADLPALLDRIPAPKDKQLASDMASWEVGSFYSRLLVRAWRSTLNFDAGKILNWLYKRVAFRGGAGESRAQSLREAMAAMPDRLNAVADHFLSTIVADKDVFWNIHKFREAILFQLNAEHLRALAMRHLEAEIDGTPKQAFLYELAFSLCYGTDEPGAQSAFEQLCNLAIAKSHLQNICERMLKCELPANYFEGRKVDNKDDADEAREKQRREFAQQVDLIRTGKHLGWLAHLAKIYFGLYDDSDQSLTARQRLAAWLGDANADPALQGLRAVLLREDLPSFADVMSLAKANRRYDWWYALVAGLDERWSDGEGFLGLSDDRTKALAAFDLMNSIYLPINGVDQRVVHPWVSALLNEKPKLMRDVYRAVARLRFENGQQLVDGLTELLADGPLELFRKEVALEFLRDFPNADPFRLSELMNAVLVTPAAHAQFLDLASAVLSGAVPTDEYQRDNWLVMAYLLSPLAYENKIEQRARVHPHLIFTLRDRSGFGFRGKPTVSLPLRMLEFMARLTGTSFANTPFPTGVVGGDTNAWDASEHFRTLINMISTMTSETATSTLERLSVDPGLASYKADILYALANQRQRRREADYDRPNWLQTVAALSNGAPATVADLHALVSEHLRDLKQRIERRNTDIWKRFWNIDLSARRVEPRPEEACRDDVVELMRPSLYPLGITVEPEGHMAGDKRADISVAMPGRKILCELKRDYHAEVWTAIEGQLDRFYLHDPEANGFGVYCVFWFGKKRKRPMPNPPKGLSLPASAAEMEKTLRDLMPENMWSHVTVIVIDVSGEY